MFTSTYGLIGLGVGLAFAVLDYLVLLPLVERPLRAGLGQAELEERDRLSRRLRLIRTIFLWQFAIFPIVGYMLGRVMEAGMSP